MTDLATAKAALDKIIKKTRTKFYKPIQIAEILYHSRTAPDSLDINNVESYQNLSQKWRNAVTIELVGSKSISSASFQKNLFEKNAMPPNLLKLLDLENKKTNGAVESYVYHAFKKRKGMVSTAYAYCEEKTQETFELQELINLFREEPGLTRSLDKIYEIVVYSLFETLTSAMSLQVDIYFPEAKAEMVDYFSDFATKVMRLSGSVPRTTLQARFHRAGVTNAADRGLDIYANFGAVVQVKHISLDLAIVADIQGTVSSENIIIVCKQAEQNVIQTVLTQVGLYQRIKSIITEEELVDWYEKALRGEYYQEAGNSLLETLREEFTNEFPLLQNDKLPSFLKKRGYSQQGGSYWSVT